MNIYDTIPRPVRNANDLIGGAIQDTVCKLAGDLQAFLTTDRGRGPSAALICLYRKSACGPACENPIPRRPFIGGQCPEPYRVRVYEFVPPSQVPPDGAVTRDLEQRYNGPLDITSTSVPQGDSGYTRYTLIDGAGTAQFSVNEWWDGGVAFFEILGRVDGGPDDCGDPQPVVPRPPVGDPGTPPTIIYPPGWPGPVYIDGTVEGDTVIGIPVNVGPVAVDVDDLFPINIEVNNQNYKISPDFDITPDTGGGVSNNDEVLARIGDLDEQLTTIDNEIEEVVDTVNRLEAEFFAEVSTNLTRGECGQEPTTVNVSGNAFAFIAAALTQESSARYAQTNSLCQEAAGEIEDVAPSLIASGTAGVNHVEFIELSPDTRVVVLNCEGNPPHLRVYRNSGPQVHAQFGFIAECIDVDSAPCPREQEYVYTREHVLVVTLEPEKTRHVRIALTEGIQWTLTDTGVRY